MQEGTQSGSLSSLPVYHVVAAYNLCVQRPVGPAQAAKVAPFAADNEADVRRNGRRPFFQFKYRVRVASMRRFLIGLVLVLLLVASIGVGITVAKWPALKLSWHSGRLSQS